MTKLLSDMVGVLRSSGMPDELAEERCRNVLAVVVLDPMQDAEPIVRSILGNTWAMCGHVLSDQDALALASLITGWASAGAPEVWQ